MGEVDREATTGGLGEARRRKRGRDDNGNSRPASRQQEETPPPEPKPEQEEEEENPSEPKEEVDAAEAGDAQKDLKELEKKKEEQINQIEMQREKHLRNILNIYDAERQMAENEFDDDLAYLKNRMIARLEKQQKQYEDERIRLSFGGRPEDAMTETVRISNKRQALEAGTFVQERPGMKKKANSSPGGINFTLGENEIMDDLNLIKRV